jgi:hypothetical protein
MAGPTSRTQLKQYVKRQLGEPVITVNVEDQQLEDRIDDALAFYGDYHFDASERTYLKHKVTWSNLVFTAASTGTFANNELVQGQTSNTVVVVNTQTSNTVVQFKYLRSEHEVSLQVGEVVRGLASNATGTISSIQLGDWDNKYLPMGNSVISVYRVLPLSGFSGSDTGMFSYQYQFLLNDLRTLNSGSVISYYLMKSHLEMLHDLFVGDPSLRFNRHKNRLYLDVDWNVDILPDQYVIVEAHCLLDPATYPEIWNDRFLKAYATALVKKQWGQNLIKFEGVQMPGGITMNGRAIYDEGVREVTEQEAKMQASFELPPEMFVL